MRSIRGGDRPTGCWTIGLGREPRARTRSATRTSRSDGNENASREATRLSPTSAGRNSGNRTRTAIDDGYTRGFSGILATGRRRARRGESRESSVANFGDAKCDACNSFGAGAACNRAPPRGPSCAGVGARNARYVTAGARSVRWRPPSHSSWQRNETAGAIRGVRGVDLTGVARGCWSWPPAEDQQ